jgi:chemotaxis signal transduction protein
MIKKYRGRRERALRLFTFCLNETEIAIRASQIKTILRAWHLFPHRLDKASCFIKGMVEYQNHKLPVTCLSEQLGLKTSKKREERQNVCIIVIQTGQLMGGVIINQINELIQLPRKEFIKPVFRGFKTPINSEISSEYIEMIRPNNNPLLILDWKKILLELTN